MFSYSVSFSHPTLDREDLEAFLEREFSLWDLTVEQDEGTPPRFRVGFQHPWLEPKTMFAFLERQYGPEDLSVARDGQASLTFTGAREPSDTARPRGPARKTETLMRSIRGLFAGNEVVDWDRIRTVSGSRPQSAVIGVLRRLVEEGEIRRLSQGRYIAKDAPDPDPEVTASPSLGALQTAILAHLETAPAATAESLIQVAKGRAKPTIQLALRGLMEAGKVRRADHGVYVLEGKADPSPDAVAKLRRRKRQKPGSQKPDAEATLLAFLTEPRRIEEVMDHLKMSRPGAARRLAVLEEAGKVARMRVGPRHLYGSDVARLAKEAGRGSSRAPEPFLEPWTTIPRAAG